MPSFQNLHYFKLIITADAMKLTNLPSFSKIYNYSQNETVILNTVS